MAEFEDASIKDKPYSHGSLEEGCPSTVPEEYWIWAVNRSGVNDKEASCAAGKWMIFQSTNEIDDAWERVKTALKAGQLGFQAKVSTIKDKQSKEMNASFGVQSES